MMAFPINNLGLILNFLIDTDPLGQDRRVEYKSGVHFILIHPLLDTGTGTLLDNELGRCLASWPPNLGESCSKN